ncbi:MAG TPA: PEGA domain-containing protein, partial [Trueperaceae bacterium]
MVPFNERLSSADIAAVASHVRSSWGNAFGVVTLAQVQDEHAAGPQQAGRQAAPPVQGLSGGGRSTGGSGGGATRAATGGRSGGAARAAGGASAGAPTGGARTGGARSGGAPSGGGRAGGARAPASGALHILVQPSGSRVTVTGPNRYLHYEAGVSREQLTGLTPGRYTVSVTKQGYQAGTQQTTVSPGKTTQVTIELKPLARQTGGGP